MKANGFLCRSHAATAVCLPGDPRSVIIPCRPDRRLTGDLKYSRLLDNRRRLSSGDRSRAVTLPMVMKKKRDAKPRPPPPPPPPTTTTTTTAATTTTTTNDHVFQVVVMRVSIHCQGCAGKVRKLISKMEGVTSFSIDLESKRVTVMGHVSPVGVLESISRVKKAEFWPC